MTSSAPIAASAPSSEPSLDAIDAELARRSLREFIYHAWPLVEPARELAWNWHLDVVCEHLEAVSAGEIPKLVMNVPPRTMKSLSTSVFWPAWEWLRDPSVQWLFASHSASLARRDARKARRLMSSEGGAAVEGTLLQRVGYRGVCRLLGQEWAFTTDENVMSRYSNDRMGYRISTGIGGEATGEGGDRVVIDDPHKLEEADSEARREEAVEFVTEVVPSRLNSKDGAVVMIMQRVHEGDATGAVLEERGWTHLCLPMEYEPNHPFVWSSDERSKAGELLWAERFPPERVSSLQRSLGSYKYAGQYQQRPAPAEGGIFKREWWRFYSPMGWPQIGTVEQSWDLAFTESSSSDYVVGQLWGTDQADRYLLAQIRARMEFPGMLEAVRALTAWAEEQGFGTHAKVVEKAAAADPLIATLRKEIAGLVSRAVSTDKEARAHAEVPQIESRNVYVPEGFIPAPPGYDPTRTETYIEEHASFPNAVHDDQVDATTQALARLRGAGKRRKMRLGQM